MNENNARQVLELRLKVIAVMTMAGVLLALSLLGGVLVPPAEASSPCFAGAESVTDYNVSCALQNAAETVLRFMSWAILVGLGRNVLMSLTGKLRSIELNEDFHSPNNNDSPVMVLVGLAIMTALVISQIPLVDLSTFTINVVFRYSLGMIYFFVFEVILLRMVGVRSLVMFVGLLQVEGTNSVAWVTFAALIMAGLFVTAPVV